jgi:hypothetical protein
MEPTFIPTPTATSGPTIPGVSLEVDSIFSRLFGSLNGDGFSFSGLIDFLEWIWSFYTILAYLFAILLLVLYVYASIRKNLYVGLQTQELRDAERLYDEQFRGTPKSDRMSGVLAHADSDSPADWKLAIIEADIILDDTLKQRGYAGNSLGERLKSVSPQQLSTLSDAWEAHKVRNRIAHDGADFVLTKRLAQETIARYQRVFTEFGI